MPLASTVELLKSDDVGIARSGAEAIASNAFSGRYSVDDLMAAGVAHALVAALAAHPSDEGLCFYGLGCLWILAAVSDAHRETIILVGAAPRIMAALAAHPMHPTACQNGLGAIMNLAAGGDPAGKAARKDELMAAGAAERITAILGAHRGDADLCQNALGALRNLSAGNDPHAEERRGLLMPAVPGILCALEIHVSDDTSATNGCVAIWNLADESSGARTAELRAAGAATVLQAIVKYMGASSETRTEATDALKKLGFGGDV